MNCTMLIDKFFIVEDGPWQHHQSFDAVKPFGVWEHVKDLNEGSTIYVTRSYILYLAI